DVPQHGSRYGVFRLTLGKQRIIQLPTMHSITFKMLDEQLRPLTNFHPGDYMTFACDGTTESYSTDDFAVRVDAVDLNEGTIKTEPVPIPGAYKPTKWMD